MSMFLSLGRHPGDPQQQYFVSAHWCKQRLGYSLCRVENEKKLPWNTQGKFLKYFIIYIIYMINGITAHFGAYCFCFSGICFATHILNSCNLDFICQTSHKSLESLHLWFGLSLTSRKFIVQVIGKSDLEKSKGKATAWEKEWGKITELNRHPNSLSNNYQSDKLELGSNLQLLYIVTFPAEHQVDVNDLTLLSKSTITVYSTEEFPFTGALC